MKKEKNKIKEATNIILAPEEKKMFYYNNLFENMNFEDEGGACYTLLPYIYNAIKKYNLESSTFNKIKGIYKYFAVQKFFEEKQLNALIDDFNERNIDVLFLNTWAFEIISRTLGCRYFPETIDFEINERDLNEVLNLLKKYGYNLKGNIDKKASYMVELEKEVKNRGKIKKAGLKIYVNCYLKFTHIGDKNAVRKLMFDKRSVNVPSPEGLLIMSILESRYNNSYLWWIEVCIYIQSNVVDWKRFMENCYMKKNIRDLIYILTNLISIKKNNFIKISNIIIIKLLKCIMSNPFRRIIKKIKGYNR